MHSKSLLIAIAAFAVTTTGVQAYGGAKIMQRIGLDDVQVQAIEEARELRLTGHEAAAWQKLKEAGIDEDTLQLVKTAARQHKLDLDTAIEEDDYDLFKEIIKDTPLGEVVTNQSEYEEFRDAYIERRASRSERRADSYRHGWFGEPLHKRHHRISFLADLPEAEREAFLVAKKANDRATMQAILDEAGIDKSVR
jgi:hypothetical protein